MIEELIVWGKKILSYKTDKARLPNNLCFKLYNFRIETDEEAEIRMHIRVVELL